MAFDKVLRALEITRPHFTDPSGYHLGAEHDEIYIWKTDTPLSEAEVAEMRALGWEQPDAAGDAYDPEQSWMRHI